MLIRHAAAGKVATCFHDQKFFSSTGTHQSESQIYTGAIWRLQTLKWLNFGVPLGTEWVNGLKKKKRKEKKRGKNNQRHHRTHQQSVPSTKQDQRDRYPFRNNTPFSSVLLVCSLIQRTFFLSPEAHPAWGLVRLVAALHHSRVITKLTTRQSESASERHPTPTSSKP